MSDVGNGLRGQSCLATVEIRLPRLVTVKLAALPICCRVCFLVSGDSQNATQCHVAVVHLCVDHLMVLFKGRHRNDVSTRDWTHVNDTQLQIFGPPSLSLWSSSSSAFAMYSLK